MSIKTTTEKAEPGPKHNTPSQDRQAIGQQKTLASSDDLSSHGTPCPSNSPAKQEGQNANEEDKESFRNRKKTVLEQHCAFFDKDGDGVIWMTDTFNTCRGFGWGLRLSLFFAVFLHLVQSWGTVPWFWLIPDPLFRIWVDNIHLNKHGSSTMAIDTEGNFRSEIFDEFFARFDKDGKGGLTLREGFQGLRRMRMSWDLYGQASSMFEWGMTYVLLWPEDGIVRKEDARQVLDGSIFHRMTKTHQKSVS